MSHIKENEYPRVLAMSNEAYDFWKHIITLVLPGIGAVYSAVVLIWNLAVILEVLMPLLLVIVIGRVLLLISRQAYKNSGAGIVGVITVDTVSPEKDVFTLDMGKTPLLSLAGRKEVTFRVDNVV
jgi:hypothetical protein